MAIQISKLLMLLTLFSSSLSVLAGGQSPPSGERNRGTIAVQYAKRQMMFGGFSHPPGALGVLPVRVESLSGNAATSTSSTPANADNAAPTLPANQIQVSVPTPAASGLNALSVSDSTGSGVVAATTGGGDSEQDAVLRGDSQCGKMMCVSAIINGSFVQYFLTALGRDSVGWLAMGFGEKMVNSPLVVMWRNSDGNYTISQRKTEEYHMPTVDVNPPRLAFADASNCVIGNSSVKTRLAFKIPNYNDTNSKLKVIYARGSDTPSSSSNDAPISHHVDKGAFELDMSQLFVDHTNDTSTRPSDNSDSRPGPEVEPGLDDVNGGRLGSAGEPPVGWGGLMVVVGLIACGLFL